MGVKLSDLLGLFGKRPSPDAPPIDAHTQGAADSLESAQQVLDVLRRDGWTVRTWEGGEHAVLARDDVLVVVSVALCREGDDWHLLMQRYWSDRLFDATVQAIFPTERIEPVDFPVTQTHVARSITTADVRSLGEAAILWAVAEQAAGGLERLTQMPTTSVGAFPLRHLAALAVLGRRPQLQSYVAAFHAGDRMGFVPYITTEMVEAALSHANGQARGEGGE
jgi:hypothetical protein